MDFLFLAVAAWAASLLSFYSGFGLGTLLMPVMAIFMPLPVAIASTALVHWIHNLLKTGLLWRAIDWRVALKFGGVSLLAAIPGALLLKELAGVQPLLEYRFWKIHGSFSWLHLSLGFLLLCLATLSLLPVKKIRSLTLGGILSGFFGALSGFQGAFRSLFLLQTDLEMRSFIGTNAAIALALDSVRLVIYSTFLSIGNLPQVFVAIGAAVIGIATGMVFLQKATMRSMEILILFLLYLFGILLAFGII